jgi:hypothetical protein
LPPLSYQGKRKTPELRPPGFFAVSRWILTSFLPTGIIPYAASYFKDTQYLEISFLFPHQSVRQIASFFRFSFPTLAVSKNR